MGPCWVIRKEGKRVVNRCPSYCMVMTEPYVSLSSRGTGVEGQTTVPTRQLRISGIGGRRIYYERQIVLQCKVS